MALAAALSCIFLAQSLRSAGCVRDEERVAFAYPPECQESCAVSLAEAAFFALRLGASGGQFKCVLKNSTELPEGRDCTAPEKRQAWTYMAGQYMAGQWKTICAFTPDEVASKAWEGLEQKCSTETWCCCNRKDEWKEDVCMVMGTEADQVFAVSPTSKVEERYERVREQQYDNKDGACAPGEGGEVPEGVQYQADYSSDFTDKGCCLKSEEMDKRISYRANIRTTGYKTKYWTGCATWQKLYRCSTDGGRTQTGQMYRRVPRRRGVCLGDESTPERLMHAHGAGAGSELATAFKGLKLLPLRGSPHEFDCPANYHTGVGDKACLCDVDCRDKRSPMFPSSRPPPGRAAGEPLAVLA